ncbi:hypothetical protein [Pseudooceanicola algae]|uniref:Uncharacterized protein n=1 Tax=Pseudooceanicola algae TaxID=1537215 RepID=A0A418SG90_9RHOB|nr:hypothetical protein [Pseudooceanicola algae]QPM91696.1 hypothetical protein PSAL_029510 [Pseudooceanicola algae]
MRHLAASLFAAGALALSPLAVTPARADQNAGTAVATVILGTAALIALGKALDQGGGHAGAVRAPAPRPVYRAPAPRRPQVVHVQPRRDPPRRVESRPSHGQQNRGPQDRHDDKNRNR